MTRFFPLRSRRPDGEAGFTAVELLVTMAISAILGVAVLTSVIRTIQVSADATVRVDGLTDLQRAHERMTRNIRAADPIMAATATTLSLTVHDDTQLRRQFDYAVVGSDLMQTMRTYTSPTSTTPSSTATTPVIEDLDQGGTDVFTYFDSSGGAWDGVSTDDIAQVQISLIADLGDSTLPLTTTVHVRNSGA